MRLAKLGKSARIFNPMHILAVEDEGAVSTRLHFSDKTETRIDGEYRPMMCEVWR